jgi:ABC-type multidrug transport system fused ATPase/permease subunit
MIKRFSILKNNIFIKRILSIRNSIISYSLASALDIITVLMISSIFDQISEINFTNNVYSYVFLTILLIIFRTIMVFLLRRISFNIIFKQKFQKEKIIVEKYIANRSKNSSDENDLNLFKEKLVNSSNLAAVNFDIPVASIISELIFALGGIIILLRIFGLKLFLFNLPVFLVLIIFSKFVSKKLNTLGKSILKYTEKRLNSIDNVSELATELSALADSRNLVNYFEKVNQPFNKILSKQIITSNMMQIYTESASFIIILISLISLMAGISSTSLADSATSLAVLSRMVPSFTRSISFITQLQFGVPSVVRLSQIKK